MSFQIQASRIASLLQYPMFTHTISLLSRLFIKPPTLPLLRLSCSPLDVELIKPSTLQMLNTSLSSPTLSMLQKESSILCLTLIKLILQLSLRNFGVFSKLVSKITSISEIVLAKPIGLCMQLLIVIPRSLSLLCPFLVNHLGIFAKIVVINPFSTPGKWLFRPLTSREDNFLNYSMMTSILLNYLSRMGAYGSSS